MGLKKSILPTWINCGSLNIDHVYSTVCHIYLMAISGLIYKWYVYNTLSLKKKSSLKTSCFSLIFNGEMSPDQNVPLYIWYVDLYENIYWLQVGQQS